MTTASDQPIHYCSVCKESCGYEIAVRRLFNSREMILVDSDTMQRHLHLFNTEDWNRRHDDYI